MWSAPRTPAWMLAVAGDVEGLRELVAHEGACSLLKLDGMGTAGYSPFHCAASQGHLPTLEYLREESGVGAQLELLVCHNGWTPLMAAADGGHVHVVEWMLARYPAKMVRAVTNHRDTNPRSTALHFAAANGHVDVVRLLATRHLDLIPMVNAEGNTAAEWARRLGELQVVELLQRLEVPYRARMELECARAAQRAVQEMQQAEVDDDARRLVGIVLRCFLVEDAEVVFRRLACEYGVR